jgi:hypothetical protein
VSEFREDEVAALEKVPGFAGRLGVGPEGGVRADFGVEVVAVFEESAGVGAALEEEGEFVSQGVAEGVAGAGVVVEQGNAHGVPP